ncbi:MAG: glycosyltransferase [Lachnospiraceae bacterium]|nr:glycosyltransferase [Lachnospiraceae bacterium]
MINSVCGIRSTGRICTDLANTLEKQGHTVKIAYGRELVPDQFERYAVRIGKNLDVKFHCIKARITDASGFGSKRATKEFIKWVNKYDPDVIHLHNIHGYYINIEILFEYLRNCGKQVIWTLHDCWPFTGHAAFCEGMNCKRWENGCYDCPNKRDYPTSFCDRSRHNWLRKRSIFADIPNLTIVTPSKWLADLVSKSFLSRYPINVIYNEIDVNIFKSTKSDIKNRLGINEKKVVLGVAAFWTKRKGLNDLIKLSTILPREYQIVIVGLSKKQKQSLPQSVMGIEKTNSINELVELYNAADVFVNPTYEDNYPTTNLEAIACGTPVVTYNTGGSSESASYYGIAVNKGDVSAIANVVMGMKFEDKRYPRIFGEGKWLEEYCDLYYTKADETK